MQTEILNKLEQLLALQLQLLNICSAFAQPILSDEWLDNTDVKRLLKISDSSLYRLRKNNILAAKRVAGKWYYQMDTLRELINIKNKLG